VRACRAAARSQRRLASARVKLSSIAARATARSLAVCGSPKAIRQLPRQRARCKGKAHRREYLGYAGRRVLVSRKWSGKTLADHRADRRTWLTSALGLPASDPRRYSWEPVKPGDPDHMPNGQRLLHVVADRIQWQTALALARRRAAEADLPATGRAA
jgi:Replication initiator protein, pSAM2